MYTQVQPPMQTLITTGYENYPASIVRDFACIATIRVSLKSFNYTTFTENARARLDYFAEVLRSIASTEMYARKQCNYFTRAHPALLTGTLYTSILCTQRMCCPVYDDVMPTYSESFFIHANFYCRVSLVFAKKKRKSRTCTLAFESGMQEAGYKKV